MKAGTEKQACKKKIKDNRGEGTKMEGKNKKGRTEKEGRKVK